MPKENCCKECFITLDGSNWYCPNSNCDCHKDTVSYVGAGIEHYKPEEVKINRVELIDWTEGKLFGGGRVKVIWADDIYIVKSV